MFLLFLLSGVYCWWEVGHMMTAQVAQNELKAKRPDVFEWADSLVKDFNSLTDGKSNTFPEAAVWADDIKETGTEFLNGWHFTNRPINPDGLLIRLSDEVIVTNSISGVNRIKSVLTNTWTAKLRHTVFKAQMMRMLLHVVGDMHQPLHNTNFFNDTYSTGDLGGNKQKIQLQNGTFVNFHSFWDAGAFSLQPNDSFLQRPLSQKDQMYMEFWARDLMVQYPLSKYASLDMTNPEVWTYVGYRQATDFTYPGVMKSNAYDKSYVDQAKRFCEENLVIGGYRLAAKLTEIYDIILQNERNLHEEQSLD